MEAAAATQRRDAPVSRVGVVIPAWNEEDAIAAVLSEVPWNAVHCLFVVLATEQDDTARWAHSRGASVLVQQRPGYGAACWEGALAAMQEGVDIIAFLDGDYSDAPGFLPLLLDPIQHGQADIALGCRDFTRFPLALPPHARLGNAFVLATMSLLLRQRIHDLPSMKAIRASALRDLNLQEMTYGFTVEMIVKSARAGLRFAQIPIPYRPRLGGHSKISGSLRGTIGASWKLLTCPARYALWHPELNARFGAEPSA